MPGDLDSRVNELARDVVKLRDQVKQLERRSDKQSAVLRATCELLQEKTGLPPVELMAKIIQVENERQKQVNECPQCQRPLKDRVRKCMYCGAEKPVESLFDLL